MKYWLLYVGVSQMAENGKWYTFGKFLSNEHLWNQSFYTFFECLQGSPVRQCPVIIANFLVQSPFSGNHAWPGVHAVQRTNLEG